MARVKNTGSTPSPQGTLIEQNAQSSQPVKESAAPTEKALTLVEDPGRAPGRALEVQERPRTPTEILLFAIQDPNLDVVKLEKLMDLQKRWADEQARRAFVVAMANFKAEAPKIVKDKMADVTAREGRQGYQYSYASLASVVNTIVSSMSKHGLSHGWSLSQTPAPQGGVGLMKVTCEVTHIEGHKEVVSMEAPYDTTGGKNAIQAIASAKSYLERYTLLAITGLATMDDEDDDGRSAGEAGLAPISEEQVTTIRQKLEELDGQAGTALLRYLKVDTIEDIPTQAYELAIDLLGRRKRQQA